MAVIPLNSHPAHKKVALHPVVETKNGEIRKTPMNKQLTTILKNVRDAGILGEIINRAISSDG